jgi:hypothetical protein
MDAQFPIQIIGGLPGSVPHIKMDTPVDGVTLPFPFSGNTAGTPSMLEDLT